MPTFMYELPPTDEMTFPFFFYLIMDSLAVVIVRENHPCFQNRWPYLIFSLSKLTF